MRLADTEGTMAGGWSTGYFGPGGGWRGGVQSGIRGARTWYARGMMCLGYCAVPSYCHAKSVPKPWFSGVSQRAV
jgi:hypothetical protein